MRGPAVRAVPLRVSAGAGVTRAPCPLHSHVLKTHSAGAGVAAEVTFRVRVRAGPGVIPQTVKLRGRTGAGTGAGVAQAARPPCPHV